MFATTRQLLSIFALALLCASVPRLAAQTPEPDFRKSKWGDTMEAVKAAETAKQSDTDTNVLYYEGALAEMPVVIAYEFNTNHLTSAAYYFTSTPSNPNDYIDDLKKVKALLEKKYGKPTEDKVIWKNQTYKEDEPHWGKALQSGDLSFATAWQTKTTTIKLVLAMGTSHIALVIQYESKMALAEQKKTSDQKEKEAIKNL